MSNLNLRKDRIPLFKVIEDLLFVKNQYNRSFTKREFDKLSQNCKSTLVISRFGSWKNALIEVGLKR